MKINSYTVAALPKLDDRLIGTSVDGTPPNGTYNFTPAELLELFQANFNAPASLISERFDCSRVISDLFMIKANV